MLPTSAKATVDLSTSIPSDVRAVALVLTEKPTSRAIPPELGPSQRSALKALIDAKAVRGKAKEVVLDYLPVEAGKPGAILVGGPVRWTSSMPMCFARPARPSCARPARRD
jgi:hypothetical protein